MNDKMNDDTNLLVKTAKNKVVTLVLETPGLSAIFPNTISFGSFSLGSASPAADETPDTPEGTSGMASRFEVYTSPSLSSEPSSRLFSVSVVWFNGLDMFSFCIKCLEFPM